MSVDHGRMEEQVKPIGFEAPRGVLTIIESI